MQLVWTSAFSRAFKRLVRQNPQLRPQIEQTLEKLLADPFHPSLKDCSCEGAICFWGKRVIVGVKERSGLGRGRF